MSVALAPSVPIACSSPTTPTPKSGEGRISGAIQGLQLETTTGVAITNATPPATEIIIAPNGVACGVKGGGDRIIIDIARSQVDSFTIVKGHPYVVDLGAQQARASACPTGNAVDQSPCHTVVSGGSVEITRFDADPGGRVEGTFHVIFADGDVTGTFSALRCS
jgi:hypothetical protein